jgi:hypothetical protein
MTSAEPVRPAVPRTREVRASVLAAFQLVEDARYFGSERRPDRARARLMAERAVAYRRFARDLGAGVIRPSGPQDTQNSLPSGSARVTHS